MIQKKFDSREIKVFPLGEKPKKNNGIRKVKNRVEIRVCLNCTKSKCKGEPCEELKKAYEQVFEEKKRRKKK